MDCGVIIAEDEPVRLLDAVLGELNYTNLLRLYSVKGRKSKIYPSILFKIIVFAMLNKKYSIRDIQKECQYNVLYMWLLEGHEAPSHMTIGRFIKRITVPVLEDLFAQFLRKLSELDSISLNEVYIDGTKLEANANRYTFVWRKNVERALAKVREQREQLYNELLEENLINENVDKASVLEALATKCKKEKITFVDGKGHHKHLLQKHFEEYESYNDRISGYEKQLAIMGTRNSYSKTDTDATFMRMKEDHMRNGQLKAAYNLQIAVESEYIVGLGLYPNPTDTRTLMPFLNHMHDHFGIKPLYVVADAGYDSEENLAFLKAHSYLSVIKPSKYEVRKQRSYKRRIGLVENMRYDESKDIYICAKGRKLVFTKVRAKKNDSGYLRYTKEYQCQNCNYCGFRCECQKTFTGEPPKNNKTLNIAETYNALQEENMERFQSNEGIQMRINRSIQVEGTFGLIKQDYCYKRVLRKGKEDVYKELLFLVFGFDLRKLHMRIKGNRIGRRFLNKSEVAC